MAISSSLKSSSGGSRALDGGAPFVIVGGGIGADCGSGGAPDGNIVFGGGNPTKATGGGNIPCGGSSMPGGNCQGNGGRFDGGRAPGRRAAGGGIDIGI